MVATGARASRIMTTRRPLSSVARVTSLAGACAKATEDAKSARRPIRCRMEDLFSLRHQEGALVWNRPKEADGDVGRRPGGPPHLKKASSIDWEMWSDSKEAHTPA